MKNKLTTVIFVLLVTAQASLFGFGRAEVPPPEVTVMVEKIVYISPGSSMGIQDELVVPIAVTPADKAVIKELRCSIFNQNDETVRTLEQVYTGPEPGLFQKAEGIDIPESITWDGKNDEGEYVRDGEYYYKVEALDNKDGRGTSRTSRVVVDNTYPSIELNAPHKVFSPVESGGRNLFILEQKGSYEKLWTGEIVDGDGNTVKTFEWESSRPENFSWNGRDDDNNLLSDGSYTYLVHAVDEAGNKTEKEFSGIVIDTTEANIGIRRQQSAFSPDNDGVKDDLTLYLDVPVTKNLLEWTLEIKNENDQTVRSFGGSDAPEKEIVFDGKNNEGELLYEGEYRAFLSALYRNGNRPVSQTSPFEIDTTPPEVSVTPDTRRFSPDGDGTKDTVVFSQDTSREDNWIGVVVDESGTSVLKIEWRGNADETFAWDGRNDAGEFLPDGEYTYTLSSTDRAGNTGTSKEHRVAIDTEITSDISLTLNRTHISPNGGSGNGSVVLNPSVDDTKDIRVFNISISDSSGHTVWSQEKTPEDWTGGEVTWEGRNEEGDIVPDGTYEARFTVIDEIGNSKSIEHSLHIDTESPAIDLAADYKLFSPNGDGRRDELVIRQDSSEEKLWEGYILNTRGEKVRSFFWKGAAEDLAWKGKDDEGNQVPDGRYTYEVAAVDESGNRTEVQLKDIEIDTRPTPVDIRWSDDAFSPDNNGEKDDIAIDLYIEVEEGIETWEVRVLDEDDTVITSITGEEDIPKSIVWDGTTHNDETAEEGTYEAALTVKYTKGNLAEKTAENSAVLDVTKPDIEISLEPDRFSPNGDGRKDVQSIIVEAKDAGGIMKWTAVVHDPQGEVFYTRSGEGDPPEKIEWDGTSSDGEVVQTAEEYPLTVEIRDRAGNRAEKKRIISVDIFATERDGKLIIEVSSLLFAPNTAEFTDFGRYSDFYKGQKEKNMKILDQIARMLKQYSDYSILIEGHGVLVHWNDPQRAEAEQEEELIPLTKKRAEAVKAALVERGVDADRIRTVGVGGANPAYPFRDAENRWKNRRVVFILEK